jgi:hypothetical protein
MIKKMRKLEPIEALLKGLHFDGQIIILCVSCWSSSANTPCVPKRRSGNIM